MRRRDQGSADVWGGERASRCEVGPSCPHLDPSRHKLIPPALKNPLFTILVPHPNLLFLPGSPSPKGLLFLQAPGQTPRYTHSLAEPNTIHLSQSFGSGYMLSPNPIPASYPASWVLLSKPVPPLKSHSPHSQYPYLVPQDPLARSLFHSQLSPTPGTPRIKSRSPSLTCEATSGFSPSSPSGRVSPDLARLSYFFPFSFLQFRASTLLFRLFLLPGIPVPSRSTSSWRPLLTSLSQWSLPPLPDQELPEDKPNLTRLWTPALPRARQALGLN